MLISHKYKFICLNPPKTGTGFRENLFLRLNKHLECTLGKNKYNQRHISLTKRPWAKFTHDFDPSDYYIFTFVRNPWERAASWFNMLRGVSSSTFISNAILNKIRISPQIDFCQNSNMKVDFVGDSACQNSELSNIFNKLDLKINGLPSRNNKRLPKEKKKLYKSYFNKDLIKYISEVEQGIINLKNYTYDL